MQRALTGLTQSPAEQLRLGKQIVGLDALRMAAACLVLVFHLCYGVWSPYMNPGRVPIHTFDFMLPIAWFGWVGVQIFFVLSGFVIAYSAHNVNATTFAQHRLIRLFPAAVLCASITAPVVLFSSNPGFGEITLRWLRSILFLPFPPYIDDSYWTLSVECAFYLIVFLTLVFKRVDKLPAVMAVVGCLSTLHWILFTLFVTEGRWPGMRYFLYGPFRVLASNRDTLLFHGCYFCLGVFLWLLLDRGFTSKRALMLLICIAGGLLEINERSGWYSMATGQPLSALIPMSLWLLSLVFIIIATRKNRQIQCAIGTRGARLLRRLGLMTYPLYLLHQAIGKAIVLAMHKRIGDLPALAFTICITFLLAYVISAFLEPPAQRWMKRLVATSKAKHSIAV